MIKRVAKLVLIAAMLVLPLQGTAAALAHVMCATDNHHTGETHSHANDDGAAAHQPMGDEGSSGDGNSFPFCCHHIVTGAPLGVLAAAAIDFAAHHSSYSPFISLFVPEQPQRPPRG